jgi:hypothetical protein
MLTKATTFPMISSDKNPIRMSNSGVKFTFSIEAERRRTNEALREKRHLSVQRVRVGQRAAVSVL